MITIDALSSESGRGEQRGVTNLFKEAFGMFRNSTTHSPGFTSLCRRVTLGIF
ncbi:MULTISPECIES: TIGR02391 family protein [Gluconobacter]|uniref:TIGR02391 family protein n=1 Tax=Gluconobacter TaxID=441 RepID=UPI0011AF7C7B|nr:hypothetical protein [Gluconobacter kondonii]